VKLKGYGERFMAPLALTEMLCMNPPGYGSYLEMSGFGVAIRTARPGTESLGYFLSVHQSSLNSPRLL